MAKDKLTDYDATASNNTDVGGVSVAEGMLPSGVNNAIREQMSHLADFAAGTSGVDVLKLQDDTDTNSIKLQAPASVTATTTFTMPDGDGSAGAVLQTDGSGQLGWSTAYRTSNLIINGAMTVAQRGTSSTGLNGYISIDRFRTTLAAAFDELALTHEQSTDAPTGFSNSYKITVSTPETALAADELLRLEQRFEGQNLQHLKKGTSNAEAVTLSFWVKGSVTGTYIVNIFDQDNTRAIAKSYTINSANTWEYKTITFDGDTTGALDNDNAHSLTVAWNLAAGTDRTSGTLATSWEANTAANLAVGQTDIVTTSGATFYITGVQLEVGETATPFEHRSYGDELARCQRYYYQVNTVAGGNLAYYHSYNDATKMVSIYHPVTMRSTPTATVTGDVGTEYQSHAGHYQAFIAATSNVTKNLDTVFFDAEL